MTTRPLTDADVSGKIVLLRVDFNVPLDDTTVTDDTRIRAALPTISWLRERGARLILCSHLGRPKGKASDELRLGPVARRLESLLGAPVIDMPAILGVSVSERVAALQDGEVMLLENLRFDPREEANDRGFAERLAALADIYVNDAFGAAHRAHASTEAVAHLLPSYLGFLMQREVDTLSRLLETPDRPFAALIGGAKVSDKIAVLENLIQKVDHLLIGGGMANTFLLATNREVGRSLVESDQVERARRILVNAEEFGTEVHLPTDVIVADSIDAPQGNAVAVEAIREQEAIFDIGPETARTYATTIDRMQTVLWNGPLGVAEKPPFAAGTRTVAEAVANSSAFTVIGGGDSVAAIEQLGLSDRIDHISTGGGATLEFLEGQTLPGIAAISDTKERE